MKISTVVDTNIFVDVLGPKNLQHREWALSTLRAAMIEGPLVLSAIVWAELAAGPLSETSLSSALVRLELEREDFPFKASFAAGHAHRLYRERGGRRERTLPDFLIGAHALVGGHRLLTRDPARYRTYFPDLRIISPETHS